MSINCLDFWITKIFVQVVLIQNVYSKSCQNVCQDFEYTSDALEKKQHSKATLKIFPNFTSQTQSNLNKFLIKLHLTKNIF